MNRQDRVLEYIRANYLKAVHQEGSAGLDASAVAEALHIQRSDASADLNRLFRAGMLKKVGKHPVVYIPADLGGEEVLQHERPVSGQALQHDMSVLSAPEQEEDDRSFRTIIGADGSIKAQIQLAKAAVSYPPNGLHTLIIGESGVGKSLLAEEMWRYAKEKGLLGGSGRKEPPFVLFSCADYADNPQLLLSQLFGHAKGAFSGATESKAGLVELAEGGILFLDEIHRLSSAGQELLFTLLDKNVYRRLGETTERQSHLMIIGATTEYPSGVLLTTFTRRIPVVICLPKLSERPPRERTELIKHFLSMESQHLELPIRVSGKVLQILRSYDCKANIGSLKNDLKLACARSYLSYLSAGKKGRERILSIDIQDLPQSVYATAAPHRPDAGCDEIGGFTIDAASVEDEDLSDPYELPIDLYGFIQSRLEHYKYRSMPTGELERMIGQELERYYRLATEKMDQDKHPSDENRQPGVVLPNVWDTTMALVKYASHALTRSFSYRIKIALAMHIQQFVTLMKAGEIIYNPNLSSIRLHHPRELDTVLHCREEIEKRLEITLPDDECGFLAMFLVKQTDTAEAPKVGLVVVAYGTSVASGMAEVANYLFPGANILSVDVLLSWSQQEIFKQLCLTVSEADEGRGVLVMGDIDSLILLEEDVCQKANTDCRVVLGVSTQSIMEAAKLTLMSNVGLDDLTDIVLGYYGDRTKAVCSAAARKNASQADQPAEGTDSKQPRDVILTVCHSGMGAAAKVREILLQNLPIARSMEIIPVGLLEDIKEITSTLKGRIRLIVGNVDPKIDNVPFLDVSKVLSGSGLCEIDLFLRNWENMSIPSDWSCDLVSEETTVALINSRVHTFAPMLPGNQVILQSGILLKEIESRILKRKLDTAETTRLYLHILCMFERLAEGETLPMSDATEYVKAARRKDYSILYSIAVSAACAMNISMLESEVCYLLLVLPEK